MSEDHDFRGFHMSEATAYGLNEAILLNQIRYWLSRPTSIEQEKVWIYSSYKQWAEQFPCWSESTLIRALNSLETQGAITSAMMRTPSGAECKHYRLGSNWPGDETGVVNLDTGGSQNDYVQSKVPKTSPRLQPSRQTDWNQKLLELESQLPTNCSTSWQILKESRANENTTKTVSASVLAKLLEEILTRCSGLTPEAIDFGMARGVPNAVYIEKAAKGYTPATNGNGYQHHQPDPPLMTLEQIRARSESIRPRDGMEIREV